MFHSASLETLVDNLKASGTDKFEHTIRHFGADNPFIFQKGVYPYEYMTSAEKFKETQLPPKEAFFSKLKDEHISDEDYERAVATFKSLGCNTMEDYHNAYLKLDVLLLADVFQAFRKLSLEIYGLDPAHFYTLPSLSWEACLKHTKIELELLTDDEMYLFLESSIRGGVSTITHRHAVANNEYMEEGQYDSDKDESYIIYLDANNLYGIFMSYIFICDFLDFVDFFELVDFYRVLNV